MKTITKEEFDKAVPEIAAQIIVEHIDKAEGSFMLATSGIMFAKYLREKLFDEEEDE